jgi:hypothetical protein
MLTLSYSPEGSPALAVFQASLSLNCVKLTIPGFPHNCLLVSCGDIGFKKKPRSNIGLEIKVPFLPLGRSCPLQTILLSDLVV